MKSYYFKLLITFIILSISCKNKNSAQTVTIDKNQFGKYWFQGKAEVSVFDLEQERYGEMRKGKVVNIFVTEDFSKSKHVKLDKPESNQKDKITVLKLNQIRKFETGIYDYSIMSSIFTPIEIDRFPYTLKSTMSIQDWCGQTFLQSNIQGNNLRIRGFSYFESESDVEMQLSKVLTEDELFNKIRLNPASIPVGKVKILPTLLYNRFKHIPFKVEAATIEILKNDKSNTLKLKYVDINRFINITFESNFPYKITGWEESNVEGKVTKAKLVSTNMTDYWAKNSNDFNALRDSMGLR